MSRLSETVGGLPSIRAWIKQAAKRINALGNIQITRSGTGDSVTMSENGVLINLRRIQGATTGTSGGSNPGLLVYRSDGTQEFFSVDDILTGYDPSEDTDWSLQFAVSGGALVAFSTTAPVGVASTIRYDGNASADPVEAQTFYSIPVIRTIADVVYTWDITGIYRENIVCDSTRGPIVELIKIG